MLPLQPERQERADARKFRVPLHSPIPLNIAQPQQSPPPPAAGEARPAPGGPGGSRGAAWTPQAGGCGWRRCRWLQPSWRMRSGDEQLGRMEAGSRSHSPATALVVGAFFFFWFRFFVKKKKTNHLTAPRSHLGSPVQTRRWQKTYTVWLK